MEYTYLPGSGLEVSKICIGTMNFGHPLEEAEAVRLTHLALDQGINFIDTANSYVNGESEKAVGKAIKGRRDKVVLATKAGFATGPGTNESGLSRKNVLEQIDKSLKRLDTDYIDIYYMHVPDYHTPIEESLDVYSTLVRSGKVRTIGISNFSAWQFCEAVHLSARHSFVAPSVSEMVYNLLTRNLEQELVPFLNRYQKAMVIYNPLAGGMLSGKHKRGAPPSGSRFATHASYAPRYWTEENFAAVDQLAEIANAEGLPMVEFAMRWCISQKNVNSIITGFSSEAQLLQNIRSIEGGALSNEALAACDEVWKQLSGNRFNYIR